MNVIEMFSGIGSQYEAIKRSKLNWSVISTADWFIPSIIAYHKLHYKQKKHHKNYPDKNKLVEFALKKHLSINGKTELTEATAKRLDQNILRHLFYAMDETKNLGNISNLNYNKIPNDFDLLTYSFPCQDLSNMGALHGYNHGIDETKNTRSGLLWQIKRLLDELNYNGRELPRFLMLENVPSLNSKRHRENFEKWKKYLKDLGYRNHHENLNAREFGIPQNRERLFMISVKVSDLDEVTRNKVIKELDKKIEKLNKPLKLEKYLRLDLKKEPYYKESIECVPNNTISRKMIKEKNRLIANNQNIEAKYSATITTKQDRHPNSGVILGEFKKNNYRFLTPRETFLLMGFKESSFDKLLSNDFKLEKYGQKNFFRRDLLYKLSGNSIVVDVLAEVFKKIDRINKEIQNV